MCLSASDSLRSTYSVGLLPSVNPPPRRESLVEKLGKVTTEETLILWGSTGEFTDDGLSLFSRQFLVFAIDGCDQIFFRHGFDSGNKFAADLRP